MSLKQSLESFNPRITQVSVPGATLRDDESSVQSVSAECKYFPIDPKSPKAQFERSEKVLTVEFKQLPISCKGI